MNDKEGMNVFKIVGDVERTSATDTVKFSSDVIKDCMEIIMKSTALPMSALMGLAEPHDVPKEDMSTKEKLLNEWKCIAEKCEECKNRRASSFDFGFGNPDADVLFISNFPVSHYSNLIEKLISIATKEKIVPWFCTSIIKCSLFTAGDFSTVSVGRCFPILKEQIDIIKPKVIVCLGNYAGRNLIGIYKSLDRKKTFLYNNEVKVVVTDSLSDYRKNPSMCHGGMVDDIEFALKEMELAEFDMAKMEPEMVVGVDVGKGEDATGVFVVEGPKEDKEPIMERIEGRKKFIVTFGYGHAYANMYVIVYAYDEAEARRIMNKEFCDKWAIVYTSEEAAGVEIFGLKLLARYVEIDGNVLMRVQKE